VLVLSNGGRAQREKDSGKWAEQKEVKSLKEKGKRAVGSKS